MKWLKRLKNFGKYTIGAIWLCAIASPLFIFSYNSIMHKSPTYKPEVSHSLLHNIVSGVGGVFFIILIVFMIFGTLVSIGMAVFACIQLAISSLKQDEPE
jgi:small-conductance mechanosensitive channel